MGGYELMIADEVFRGRFRKSFEKPEPIVSGEVTPFTIDLHTNDHVFHEGASDYGAGAEHVVSGDRPESAEICAEYFEAQGGGLSEGDAEDLEDGGVSVECGDSGGGEVSAE